MGYLPIPEKLVLPTPISTPSKEVPKTIPSIIHIETPIPETQKPKGDSTVSIEICRAQSKAKRLQEEKKTNDDYIKSEMGIYELSNTQNNGQTETVALKYGYMTEENVIRSADIYQQAINEGYSSEIASGMAESMLNTYSTYLRSLHDWGKNEIDKWNTLLKTEFDSYENKVYQGCLNTI